MEYWLVTTYKINELSRLEQNLESQKFLFYIPKILTKKHNGPPKVELMFPGYCFVKTSIKNYSILKYTKGIKDIIKFGNHISFMTENEITSLRTIEKESKSNPISANLLVGQDVLIASGSFAGSIVEICSLPRKDRISVFLNILGSNRKVEISMKDISS